MGHFSEPGTLSAQQIAHRGLALGTPIAEAVDPFALGQAGSGLRLALHRLPHRAFLAFCADARTFSFCHWSSNVGGTTVLKSTAERPDASQEFDLVEQPKTEQANKDQING